jgi:hypothetical protein
VIIGCNSNLTGFGASNDEYTRHYQPTVNPRDVEYEPNPVIHAHLHERNPVAPHYRDIVMEELLEPPSVLDMEGGLDLGPNQYRKDEETLLNSSVDVFGSRPASTSLPQNGFTSNTTTRNGPATAMVELSSFPCSLCPMTFNKAYERKYVLPRLATCS